MGILHQVFYRNPRLSRFCWKLLGDFDGMWTFLRVPGMEPTNNQAERDLRPMVLWRKKSLGTNGPGGVRFVTVVGSIVQTLKKQRQSVFRFLCEALDRASPNLTFSSLLT